MMWNWATKHYGSKFLRACARGFVPYLRKKGTMSLDLEINRIVWIDLEMSGLDVRHDTIMEIACIVTDGDLNIFAEGPNLIIKTPEDLLDNMDEWCKKQHGKTGLTEAARTSSVTLESAERTILDFLRKHVTEKQSALAGNSIYMDRIFLQKYMPLVNDYLHYRIIDTSTIKELCRRWNNELYRKAPVKQFNHRALSDIKESINELKFYKENFFKTK